MNALRDNTTRWGSMQLKLNPKLLVEQLGRDLYDDRASLLWEIVRNGLVACMADPDRWTPESTKVETRVTKGHPLCRESRALIVLDYGCGFTDANMERFHELGNQLSRERSGSNAGASQKRLGRLALFPLSADYNGDIVDAPIYLLTRTAPTGNVTLVTLSAKNFCEGRLVAKTIKPTASELGPFVGIKGSFSMFVIPNTVIEDDEELYHALKWRVPRFAHSNVNLTINGKRVEPPALAKHSFKVSSSITAMIDKNLDAGHSEAGIWLCDAETGLRCSLATKLSPSQMPYPLNSPLLKGDIFIPNILSQQDTSRSSLNSDYLKSKEWRAVMDSLRLHLVEHATKLLGNADEFKPKDPVSKTWSNLVQHCNNAYGVPSRRIIPGHHPFTESEDTVKDSDENSKSKPGGSNPSNGGTSNANTGGTSGSKGTNSRPKNRGFTARIGEHDYVILMTPRPSDQDVFGVLIVGDDDRDRQLHFNPDYDNLKRLRGITLLEHMFLRFIELIAEHEYPDHPLKRQKHASQLRSRLGTLTNSQS